MVVVTVWRRAYTRGFPFDSSYHYGLEMDLWGGRDLSEVEAPEVRQAVAAAIERGGYNVSVERARRFASDDVEDEEHLVLGEIANVASWGGASILAVTLLVLTTHWFIAVLRLQRLILRRKSLREQGRCPRCEYDMSGLTCSTCPECGQYADKLGASKARTLGDIGVTIYEQ